MNYELGGIFSRPIRKGLRFCCLEAHPTFIILHSKRSFTAFSRIPDKAFHSLSGEGGMP